MFWSLVLKNLPFIPLLALLLLALLMPSGASESTDALPEDAINLALRRTADALLRTSGDSTSRIPAVGRTAAESWRLDLQQPFHYDSLPGLLQYSLELHHIRRPYHVAVRRCMDDVIELGYDLSDVTDGDSLVACGGREMPEGCLYIEVTFTRPISGPPLGRILSAIILLLVGGYLVYGLLRPKKQPSGVAKSVEWLHFGNSRLDAEGLTLVANGVVQTLTFREAKLLRLFAGNPDQLLDRALIIRQVWADEGVLVGRSVDMFVSRLRKKLAPDTTIAISAVHGVGYKLETGRAL